MRACFTAWRLSRGCLLVAAVLCSIVTGARGLTADDKPEAESPQGPAAPEKPEVTAVDAAKDYTRRMKSDQPITAVRTYWDVDAMLTGIFGEHLRRHNDREMSEIKRLLTTFVENVYTTPGISSLMKQATFEDFREQAGPAAGTTAVSFNVRVQDKVIANALHFKQIDGKWKVFDAGTGGRMLVSAIRSQYEPQAARITPLDYIKAMVSQPPGDSKKPDKPNGAKDAPKPQAGQP